MRAGLPLGPKIRTIPGPLARDPATPRAGSVPQVPSVPRVPAAQPTINSQPPPLTHVGTAQFYAKTSDGLWHAVQSDGQWAVVPAPAVE